MRFLTTPQFPEVGVQQHLHPPRELPKSLMASAARVPRWAGSPRLVFQDIRLSAGTLCNISSKTAPLCQMTEVPPASLPLPCASELCVPCSVGTGARQQGYCPSINHLKINISLCCRAYLYPIQMRSRTQHLLCFGQKNTALLPTLCGERGTLSLPMTPSPQGCQWRLSPPQRSHSTNGRRSGAGLLTRECKVVPIMFS